MSSTFNLLARSLESAEHCQLDGIAKAIWVNHGAGLLSDSEADALFSNVQVQRSAAEPRSLGRLAARVFVGSRPRRPEHVGRRRSWVASGWVPPAVAALVSPAHAAVLSVVAREVFERGVCKLCNAALASIAGVSLSTVKQAARVAESLGLIKRIERRVACDRNLSTVITIEDARWLSWLAHRAKRGGGGKSPATFQQTGIRRGAERPSGLLVGQRPMPLRGSGCLPRMPEGAFGERGAKR